MLPRTLYGRMLTLMVVLMLLTSAFYVALAIYTTRRHLEEVDQTLNRDLSGNIVKDWLLRGNPIDRGNFGRVIATLMAVNPSIEVYLLDDTGRILGYSAPPERVKLKSVALAPIAAFLDHSQSAPIFGDDPRHPDGKKIFSVSPIYDGPTLTGYVYTVLGGEQYDSVMSMLRQSYVLRLSLATLSGGFLIVLIVGFASFTFLTRRLRLLNTAITDFNSSDFRQTPQRLEFQPTSGGDEIDQFAIAFTQMSQQIHQQMQRLELADTHRRELMASISHDLRTPLSSLQGYVETVLMKIDTLSEEQKKQYLSLAFKNGQKLSHLVDELFEYSTLDTGDRPLRIEMFSLSDLIQDVTQKFEFNANDAGVRLVAEIPRGAVLVKGDVGLIERLLDNLIDNAIKFSPAGARVSVAVKLANGRARVEVRDNGVGIAAADLPHIFEPFYRSAGIGMHTRDGAGLGLAIARRIAEVHHSELHVESALGEGSLFWFELAAAD